MRQIDLMVQSPCSDDMLANEAIEKPLMKIDLNGDIDKVKTENNLIEDVVFVRQNENKTVETIIVTINDGGNALNCSPRSSRSSSLNSSDIKETRIGPGYERNLLKKRLVVPDVSLDQYDELKLDEETRLKILDYKSDNDKPGVLRKMSLNERLRHLTKDITKDKNVKKLIKSPSLLRKSQSFKNTDSCVSSSAETSETEKRKKRKISIGKRRKVSKQPPIAKEEMAKPEKAERSTKFRRRKLLKSKSDTSLSTYHVNKSKLVLLYSGDSQIKTEINRNNRLGMLKKADSIESSSEYDEYSSDNSNVQKPRKSKRGFAKKVWKSINSLFTADDQSSKPLFSTPPLLRRYSSKSYKKYRSMPGGLNRMKSSSGEKNTSKLKSEENLLKDDLFHLDKKDSSEQSLLDENANKIEKFRKWSRDRIEVQFKTKRSKSMDVLYDKYGCGRKNSDTLEWFQRRKKANTVLTSCEYDKKTATNELQYKIMLSQEPQQNAMELRNIAIIKSVKSLSFDNAESLIQTPNESLKKANDRQREYVKVRLNDLKLSSQKEMENFLSQKKFLPEHVNNWCRTLSEFVKERIVHITADNYKVVVQVFIGALCDDGIHAAVQCTSEEDKLKETNDFFTVTYKGKDMFAVASVLTFEL